MLFIKRIFFFLILLTVTACGNSIVEIEMPKHFYSGEVDEIADNIGAKYVNENSTNYIVGMSEKQRKNMLKYKTSEVEDNISLLETYKAIKEVIYDKKLQSLTLKVDRSMYKEECDNSEFFGKLYALVMNMYYCQKLNLYKEHSVLMTIQDYNAETVVEDFNYPDDENDMIMKIFSYGIKEGIFNIVLGGS